MEITRQKTGDLLVIRLNGRLDANWCGHVQNALASAIRDGEHRIHLDMAQVSYVSSAGLRVLLTSYKQLKGINGVFGIVPVSDSVRSVLELAGLDMLIAPADRRRGRPADTGRAHASASARYEIFAVPARPAPACGSSLGRRGRRPGPGRRARAGPARRTSARRPSPSEWAPSARATRIARRASASFSRWPASAAFQPADGSSQPDFVVSEGALVPKGYLLLGLAGRGRLPHAGPLRGQARGAHRRPRRTRPNRARSRAARPPSPSSP